MELEKAFDRVPQDVLWWALRQSGGGEWLVRVIQAMYADSITIVILGGGQVCCEGWRSSRIGIVAIAVQNCIGRTKRNSGLVYQ